MLAYTQRQWNDYTAMFGKEDTLGFSIITQNRSRLESLPATYGRNPPSVFDLHVYDTAADVFTYAKMRLDQLGYGNADWIIGETYDDIASTAPDLRTAMQTTGKSVRYILQWPTIPNPSGPAINGAGQVLEVEPAVKFVTYIAFGF